MSWPKQLFHFYLDASIHVALAVFALVKVTSLNLNISANGHLAWFLFFATICCYNFIKYGVEAEKYILVSTSYQKHIQGVSFLAGAMGGYHFFFLSSAIWIGLSFLAVMVALYALPLLPQHQNLRNWAGLKVFIVAGVWAATTVFLPAWDALGLYGWDLWIEALQRFIVVLVLLLPFEIRDLAYDAPELQTLPQRLGVERTRKLGVVLAVFFFLLTFAKDDLTAFLWMTYGLVFMVLLWVLCRTSKNQSPYFSAFLVEGVPVFWWLLCLAFLELGP